MLPITVKIYDSTSSFMGIELKIKPISRIRALVQTMAEALDLFSNMHASGPWKVQELVHRNDRHLWDTSHAAHLCSMKLPCKRRVTSSLAIDCEMVGVGPRGSRSALGRVSVVNKFGYCLLDTYVVPEQRITDWRTRWSGLSQAVFDKASAQGNLRSFEDARKSVLDLITGRILIGHAIHNDLQVLNIADEPLEIIDTQRFYECEELGLNKQYSLKSAMSTLLDVSIQQKRGHSSLEDAQATMLLFRALISALPDKTSKWREHIGLNRN